jgi:hypothetical protein
MGAQRRDKTGNAINSFSVYLHFVLFFLVVGLFSRRTHKMPRPPSKMQGTFFNQTGPKALKQGIFGNCAFIYCYLNHDGLNLITTQLIRRKHRP